VRPVSHFHRESSLERNPAGKKARERDK